MSEKETNEILEEQRRARQEFLELKKMQSGEMKAPPKPSEVAIVPKTPKEKWDNFWFQYKWYVVAITAVTVVLAVLITQCATRTKYDMEVVYFTYTAALDEQTNAVAKYIAGYAEDVNGDGEINIQVVNCSFNGKSGDTQYRYTMMTKLQAMNSTRQPKPTATVSCPRDCALPAAVCRIPSLKAKKALSMRIPMPKKRWKR